jgi:hypothetical protein
MRKIAEKYGLGVFLNVLPMKIFIAGKRKKKRNGKSVLNN